MKVLINCEYSGIVREAFRRAGHDAWSCDLLPTEIPGQHILGDAIEAMQSRRWDMMIAHPPCTYLSCSGLHWNKRRPDRAFQTEAAIAFATLMLNAPIAHIALENPIGCLSTRIRKPDQIIQPYQFGEDASKATCLWLKNLPPLREGKYIQPRMVCTSCKGVSPYKAASKDGCDHCGAEPGLLRPRWANQTDSGQNKLGPSPTRAKDRAKTYAGIAAAMAEQWGNQAGYPACEKVTG